MTRKPQASTDEQQQAIEQEAELHERADNRKICGIVMPIASMGEDYPEAHWIRVRKILQRAIERAGLKYKLVWENPEVDVIQSAILQNIYENDVIVCDVSNLNPNVMLETGLRLSTKKPTIIVTDKVKRPPFDIGSFSYIDYQKDLEYNATELFIDKLSKKIMEVNNAAENDRYHSYVEQFRFETVEPTSVTVTTDDYLKERVDEISQLVRRLHRNQDRSRPSSEPTWIVVALLSAELDAEQAGILELAIDDIKGIVSHFEKLSDDDYAKYTIKISSSSSSSLHIDAALEKIASLIKRAEENSIPF